MPLFFTHLMTEVVSSFYTKLVVGKEANMVSVDMTLGEVKVTKPRSVREKGHILMPPLYQINLRA